MSWLVDNAGLICLVLGILAAALVAVWRFNQQAKYLGFAGGVLGLLIVFWIATRFIVTDAKQIESNVDAMAKALQADDKKALFKHLAKDFAVGGMAREDVYGRARAEIKDRKITKIEIMKFRVEVSREKQSARATFLASTFGERDQVLPVEAEFVFEEDQWKLKTVRY
jgi:hypothetical protein